MEYYNGQYEQHLEVAIKSHSHDVCLDISKIIRKYCDSWQHCVSYSEQKSARHGDVLRRSIMVIQKAYAHDIIIFKEGLSCICFHHDSPTTSVEILNISILPKDSRINLLK